MPSLEQQAKEARQAGYQDGYRDGLAAMESFKQTQAAQMAAFMSEQVGSVATAFHGRLDAVEQQLSGRIAGVALELARQVVRSEVALRPELVVQVAAEALQTLLDSARHVTVHLNPQDMRFTTELLQERLENRGARLVADTSITPGGCLVESDIALVDATLEARWEHAATALGMTLAWNEPGHAMPLVLDDGDDEEVQSLDPEAQP
jgi:flagellar biosynthesis/type III secretory pathway protein FliH